MTSSVMIGYRIEGEAEVAIMASCEARGWRISGEEFPNNACWISLSDAIRQARRRWALLGQHYRCIWFMANDQMFIDLSEDLTYYADINGSFDRDGFCEVMRGGYDEDR